MWKHYEIYLLNRCVRLKWRCGRLVPDQNYFLKDIDTWEEEVGISDIDILVSVMLIPKYRYFGISNTDLFFIVIMILFSVDWYKYNVFDTILHVFVIYMLSKQLHSALSTEMGNLVLGDTQWYRYFGITSIMIISVGISRL